LNRNIAAAVIKLLKCDSDSVRVYALNKILVKTGCDTHVP